MSDSAESTPRRGKAKRHVIPNENQCWPLLYKMGKGNWSVHSVHLDYDSAQEARDELREQFEDYDTSIQTRMGSRKSPTELVGGEHVVRE